MVVIECYPTNGRREDATYSPLCSSTSTAPPCCFSFLQVLYIVRRERLLMVVVAAVVVVAMVTGVMWYLDTGISSGNLAEMTVAEAGTDSSRTD